MAVLIVEKNVCKAESLYQWDQNQALEIYGLSVPKIPEIHFTNTAMDRAIVRQAQMDAEGVITVDVPNSLLQKPYPITVYICMYTGSVFETLYKLTVPVIARTQPADYTLEDDDEVYSFTALENLVNNTIRDYETIYNISAKKLDTAVTEYNKAVEIYEDVKKQYDASMETFLGIPDRVKTLEDGTFKKNETLSDETKLAYGLDADGTPTDVLDILNTKFGSIATYISLVGNVNTNMINATLGQYNEDENIGLGKALAMYAKFKDNTIDIYEKFPNLIKCRNYKEVGELFGVSDRCIDVIFETDQSDYDKTATIHIDESILNGNVKIAMNYGFTITSTLSLGSDVYTWVKINGVQLCYYQHLQSQGGYIYTNDSVNEYVIFDPAEYNITEPGDYSIELQGFYCCNAFLRFDKVFEQKCDIKETDVLNILNNADLIGLFYNNAFTKTYLAFMLGNSAVKNTNVMEWLNTNDAKYLNLIKADLGAIVYFADYLE